MLWLDSSVAFLCRLKALGSPGEGSGVLSLPAGCVGSGRESLSPSALGSFAVRTVMVTGITSEGNCSPCLTLGFFARICFVAGT